MSSISASIDHYLTEYARIEQQLAGQNWLGESRHRSLRAFAERGFPTARNEDWKYTDLRALEKRRFAAAGDATAVTAEQLAPFCPAGLEDVHRLVFVDGHFAPSLSAPGALPEGVSLGALSAVLEQPDDDLRASLGSPINGYASAFTDMNAAFVSDGLHLALAEGAVLAAPIHLLVVSSGSGEEAMSQVRNVLRLGANSQAMLIEHYVGLGDVPYFCNAVTEVHAGPGSNLSRFRVQQESSRGYHISSFHAHQQRDSHIVNYGVDFGGRMARADTNSRLDAEGATAEFYGVYVPTSRQHMDNHTRVDHAKPNGTSRGAYKGVLDDRGRGVFNGKVYVHRDAQKTDSEQSSAALLLSKQAEVDAKPELEIYADDVKCAHGSTVGQLDRNAVFYLMSRGIDRDDARAILTYSFVDELLQGISLEPLRRYLETAFLAKMPEGARYVEAL